MENTNGTTRMQKTSTEVSVKQMLTIKQADYYCRQTILPTHVEEGSFITDYNVGLFYGSFVDSETAFCTWNSCMMLISQAQVSVSHTYIYLCIYL